MGLSRFKQYSQPYFYLSFYLKNVNFCTPHPYISNILILFNGSKSFLYVFAIYQISCKVIIDNGVNSYIVSTPTKLFTMKLIN